MAYLSEVMMQRVVLLAVLLCLSSRVFPQTNDTSRANMLIKLASDYSRRNAFLVEKYAGEGLVLSRKLNFPSGIMRSMRLSGHACLDQGKFPDALDNLLEALTLAEQEHNRLQTAAVLNELGELYLTLNDFVLARSYLDRSIQIYSQLKDEFNTLKVYGNISQTLQGIGQEDQAKTLTMDVLASAIKTTNNQAIADSYQNLGNIYAKSEELDKSLFWYQKAVPAYIALNDEINRLRTISKIGLIYYRKGDLRGARSNIYRSLLLAIDLSSSQKELEAYRHLSSIDSLQGKMKLALLNFQRYSTMKDSVAANYKQLKLEKIQADFDLATQQKSIDNLVKVKQDQEKSLKTQNVVIVTFFVLILFIAVMWLVLNYFYKQKRTDNKNLQSQKEELVALNHIKDRLFSVISHDLRSPLANLEALLTLMDDGDLSTEEVLMLAGQLTHNVQDTSNMLDNLLQWSKSQMDGQQPKKQKADLKILVEDIVHFFRQQSEKKAITVKMLRCETSITCTDVEMIRLVIRNLLGNAIKFTPIGGTIQIEIKTREEMLLVSIKDSGIGISESTKERLFSGDTISTAGTHNEKGTGLGLLLCKEFVEKNGGKIWLQSELGQGSVFSFSLPLIVEQLLDPGTAEVMFF